jgi:GrpB-like predicted nucleotidyltransferase (UPF0157 family)
MAVTVLPYSVAWPRLFEAEATTLRQRLAPWLVEDVYHVGSTAVPGLAAKPVIDMIAEIRNLDDARQAIPVLTGLGYRHADHRPHEALWFFKQDGDHYDTRTHQLHLTTVSSALWIERLTFRDALCRDPTLAAEYEAIKRRLADNSDDLTDYAQGKRSFVTTVLRDAGVDIG